MKLDKIRRIYDVEIDLAPWYAIAILAGAVFIQNLFTIIIPNAYYFPRGINRGFLLRNREDILTFVDIDSFINHVAKPFLDMPPSAVQAIIIGIAVYSTLMAYEALKPETFKFYMINPISRREYLTAKILSVLATGLVVLAIIDIITLLLTSKLYLTYWITLLIYRLSWYLMILSVTVATAIYTRNFAVSIALGSILAYGATYLVEEMIIKNIWVKGKLLSYIGISGIAAELENLIKNRLLEMYYSMLELFKAPEPGESILIAIMIIFTYFMVAAIATTLIVNKAGEVEVD